MDYLDAMIEAYVKALADRVNANKSLYETRRIAMKAAHEAVRQIHWGNPLAKLGNPKSWGDMNEAEKSAAWDEAFTKRTGSPALAAAECRKALALQRGDYREQAGDGVALMSIAHPEPCSLFLDIEEKERQDRIWEATKLAAGG